VLRAGPAFHLIEIGLSIDGEGVMTYRRRWTDRRTPFGRRAHSLSAASDPAARRRMFVITPICAHTLTHAVVDGDHSSTRSPPAVIGHDARRRRPGASPLVEGDRIETAAAPRIPDGPSPGHSFYPNLAATSRLGISPGSAARRNEWRVVWVSVGALDSTLCVGSLVLYT